MHLIILIINKHEILKAQVTNGVGYWRAGQNGWLTLSLSRKSNNTQKVPSITRSLQPSNWEACHLLLKSVTSLVTD